MTEIYNCPNVIICPTFDNFPNKDAGSVRLMAIAKALVKAGYAVRVISMGTDAKQDWEFVAEGIAHLSLRDASKGKRSLIKSYLTFNKKVGKLLNKFQDVKGIMVFNTMFFALKNRAFYKKKVPLIYDSTEWFTADEFKQGVFAPSYISNAITVKHYLKNPWKVIAISRFLEEHYKKNCDTVIRIPAVMDVASMPFGSYQLNDCLRIVYAGSPGIKDALYMILRGISLLPKEAQDRFTLRVIGVTKEQYFQANAEMDIPENVIFLGRVSRETVLEELAQADYSTFVRDGEKRFAKAGFPSKLAESMSMGVPVITNLTSDLALYLKDEENAIVVKDFTPEAYAEAMAAAVAKDKETLLQMHYSARKTALESFDYANYAQVLKDLLQ